MALVVVHVVVCVRGRGWRVWLKLSMCMRAYVLYVVIYICILGTKEHIFWCMHKTVCEAMVLNQWMSALVACCGGVCLAIVYYGHAEIFLLACLHRSQLSFNKFSGTIPESISSLTHLESLCVSAWPCCQEEGG